MPGHAQTSTDSSFLIYLVDDEEMLLNLAEASLRREGYALKKFQNPELAFESFTREPQKPSLLLTDYAMPLLNGVELSAKCKSACPGVKILMISGTAGPEIMNESPGAVDQFLAKPYKPADLALKVRSMLVANAV